MQTRRCGRRDFLRCGLAAGGAGLAAQGLHVAGADVASRNRVRLGFIGVGTRGIGHVTRCLRRPDVDVPAICDLDPAALGRASQTVEQARGKRSEGYGAGAEDYRRIFGLTDEY